MTVIRSSPSGGPQAPLLAGTNLIVNSNDTLSPRTQARRFFDWDYFCTGPNSGLGQIGRMGWTLVGTGATLTRQNATLSAPNKLLLSTQAVAGSFASLTLGDIATRIVANPASVSNLQAVWTLAGSLANKGAFVGYSANFDVNPLGANVNAFGLAYFESVSPNYLIINQFGTSDVRTLDTGIAPPASAGQLVSIVQPDPSNFMLFDIYLNTDDGIAVSTPQRLGSITLAGPVNEFSLTGNLGFQVQTTTNAIASVELGYWGITSRDPIVGYTFDT